MEYYSQLSPGVSFIYDLAPDGGILEYYKVNYLLVGVRIWFWVNCGSRVFGDIANFSSEIG